jgi:hypothetical protein
MQGTGFLHAYRERIQFPGNPGLLEISGAIKANFASLPEL